MDGSVDYIKTIGEDERQQFEVAVETLMKSGFPATNNWPAFLGMDHENEYRLHHEMSPWEPKPWQSLAALGLVNQRSDRLQVLAHLRQVNLDDLLDIESSAPPLNLITDVVDYHLPDRVFPWVDEGCTLVREAMRHSAQKFTSPRVLDIGTGSGTVSLLLHQLARTKAGSFLQGGRIVGIDVSERALLRATLNRTLNRLSSDNIRFSMASADSLPEASGGFDMVFVDLPMAMHPRWESEFGSSGGGAYGDKVIKEVMRGDDSVPLADLIRPGGECHMLAQFLGPEQLINPATPDEPRSVLHEFLRDSLGDGELAIHPLSEERVWRVGREKRFKNPMRIEYMITRLYDRTYSAADVWECDQHDSAMWHDRYTAWIEQLRSHAVAGHEATHLHYAYVYWRKNI